MKPFIGPTCLYRVDYRRFHSDIPSIAIMDLMPGDQQPGSFWRRVPNLQNRGLKLSWSNTLNPISNTADSSMLYYTDDLQAISTDCSASRSFFGQRAPWDRQPVSVPVSGSWLPPLKFCYHGSTGLRWEHYGSPRYTNAPQKKGFVVPYLFFTSANSTSIACLKASGLFIFLTRTLV